jgi:hypothetical protein
MPARFCMVAVIGFILRLKPRKPLKKIVVGSSLFSYPQMNGSYFPESLNMGC